MKNLTLNSGNFGHNMQSLCLDLRLVRYYPAEAISELIFRKWHFS